MSRGESGDLGIALKLCAAAHASFSTITGSLEKGKRFDAVIWDDDLLNAPEGELLDVRVKATIIDGQIAWGQVG